MGKGCKVKVNTGQGVASAVVQQRLRTLLELAVAIGRRQGLLGKSLGAKGERDGNKDAP